MLVAVVAVIVGMIVMADNARQDADRARQAQVLMERVRTESEKVEALTWETMATTRSGSRPDPAMIAEALDAYRDLTASLRGLHRLGSSRGSVDEVETRVGGAYGEGLKALIMSRRDPTLARKLALERFTPAMTKLDAAITVAARRQSDIAEAALVRGRIGSLGSLVGGLALLALLGWRLHRRAAASRGSRARPRSRAARRGAPAGAGPPFLRCRRRDRRVVARAVGRGVRRARPRPPRRGDHRPPALRPRAPR